MKGFSDLDLSFGYRVDNALDLRGLGSGVRGLRFRAQGSVRLRVSGCRMQGC